LPVLLRSRVPTTVQSLRPTLGSKVSTPWAQRGVFIPWQKSRSGYPCCLVSRCARPGGCTRSPKPDRRHGRPALG
jgi:hypothetical protein